MPKKIRTGAFEKKGTGISGEGGSDPTFVSGMSSAIIR